jgi:hypothetical protein
MYGYGTDANLFPLFAGEEEVAGVEHDLVQFLFPCAAQASNPVIL